MVPSFFERGVDSGRGGGGGNSHIKVYGDVLPKSDKDPTLVKKILRRGSHFTKIVKKMVKSAVFEAQNPFEMGPDLRNFQKKSSNQLYFE